MTDNKDQNESKPITPAKPPLAEGKGQAGATKPETRTETAASAAKPPQASPAQAPKPPQAAQAPAGGGGQAPKPKPESPAGTATPGAGGPKPPETPPPPSGPPSKPSAGGGRGLAVFALLVALIAAGGSGYLWYLWDAESRAQSAEIDTRLQQALSKAQEQSATEIGGLRTELEAQKTGLEALEKQLSGQLQEQEKQLQGELQSQQQLLRAELKEYRQKLQDQDTQLQAQLQAQEQALESAITRFQDQTQSLQLAQRGILGELEAAKTAIAKGDINALALAEVEYLLRLADYKLRFQRDVTSAIEALDTADKRLIQVNELPFATVQRMIRENLATLRAVKLPDLSALSQQIAAMQQQVDGLRLRIDVQVASLKERVVPPLPITGQGEAAGEPEAPWWERAMQSAWAQLKDIVIVRHERSGGPPLIAMEEEYFLRQNLRLELEAMRLALLQHDAASFQAANQLIRDWTETYFDTTAESVTGFLKELQELHAVQLNPYIPDISGTVRAFQDAMERRQPMRSPAAEAAPAPQPEPAVQAEPSAEGQPAAAEPAPETEPAAEEGEPSEAAEPGAQAPPGAEAKPEEAPQ